MAIPFQEAPALPISIFIVGEKGLFVPERVDNTRKGCEPTFPADSPSFLENSRYVLYGAGGMTQAEKVSRNMPRGGNPLQSLHTWGLPCNSCTPHFAREALWRPFSYGMVVALSNSALNRGRAPELELVFL